MRKWILAVGGLAVGAVVARAAVSRFRSTELDDYDWELDDDFDDRPPQQGDTVPDDLLAILACPACKSPVEQSPGFLTCVSCGRRYPIRDGIPVMLVEEGDKHRVQPGAGGGTAGSAMTDTTTASGPVTGAAGLSSSVEAGPAGASGTAATELPTRAPAGSGEAAAGRAAGAATTGPAPGESNMSSAVTSPTQPASGPTGTGSGASTETSGSGPSGSAGTKDQNTRGGNPADKT